jgi:ubiquinone biosynthesis monooxygenase Coq7
MTETANPPAPRRRPGDPSPKAAIARMIRVDHAGEYGAQRIYQGQLAILRGARHEAVLRHMQAQEEAHLTTFTRLIGDRQVRPTALLPFWHVAGFALGAATALLGPRAAMACTVAVEETIDEHYRAQTAILDPAETELHGHIEQFRAEELEHRAIGLENGAEQTPGYRALSAAIKAGCRLAIQLSERI